MKYCFILRKCSGALESAANRDVQPIKIMMKLRRPRIAKKLNLNLHLLFLQVQINFLAEEFAVYLIDLQKEKNVTR